MEGEICYDIIIYRTARCALTWWPTGLPCESAADHGLKLNLSSLRETGVRLGQVLYLRFEVWSDIIGLYRKLWRVFKNLHDEGKLDRIYAMVDISDPFLEFYRQRLYFKDQIYYGKVREYTWNLAGDRDVFCLFLDIAEVLKNVDNLSTSQKNIVLGR